MIEVYRSTNTNYQKNGDITLTPLECIFEWGLDGICQIELTHEYDDLGRWEYLVNDNVIAAPTPYSDKQLFRIYKREKSDDEVTVYARHIYYDNLGNYLVDVRPTNKNGQQALDIIFSGTKFTPHSDITTANTAYYVRKNIVEAIAGDDENSFINRWGGERLYDNYDVYIMRQIGSDKGVRAEFGHNLEAIEESVSDEDVVTRIIPVAYNGYVLEGAEPWVDSPKIGSYAEVKGAVINFDDIKLQEDCSEGETGYANLTALRAALVKACNEEYKKGIDDPTVNYTVNMVELANTVEYAEYKQLESVEVGDTITCTEVFTYIIPTAGGVFGAAVIWYLKAVQLENGIKIQLGMIKKLIDMGEENPAEEIKERTIQKMKDKTEALIDEALEPTEIQNF